MAIDPRTPVLVAAGAVQQRLDDSDEALEATTLMARALEGAAQDAGNPALLEDADSIRIPRGLWDYRDPGRLVADAVGARRARSQLAQIGVLQTTLLGGAARDIAEGREDIVLVTGGEAKWRSSCAARAGRPESRAVEPDDAAPDEELVPAQDILHPLEMELGLGAPVAQYALLETALRHAQGRSPDEHARRVAEIWAGLSRAVVDNPCAWSREPVAAETVLELGERNRMIAYPYARLHNSQWNVDQAAGLVLCAHERAIALGLDPQRFVYPLAVADSNHIVTVVERADLAACPGFSQAAARCFETSGLSLEDVGPLELYSCFPVAVELQLAELGIAPDRDLSVTGGMAFAGGPLNNFVLQAVARMAQVLRDRPGETGLVTAVSTIVTKQGVSLWSTNPPAAPFVFSDVSAEVAKHQQRAEVVFDLEGEATIAAYTVLHGRSGPERAVAVCDAADGRRTLAASTDPVVLQAMEREEWCGRPVVLAQRSFRPLEKVPA